jgi:hypothetical protein
LANEGSATTAISVPWPVPSSLQFFLEGRQNMNVHADSTHLIELQAIAGVCFVLKMCRHAKLLGESLTRNLTERHIQT